MCLLANIFLSIFSMKKWFTFQNPVSYTVQTHGPRSVTPIWSLVIHFSIQDTHLPSSSQQYPGAESVLPPTSSLPTPRDSLTFRSSDTLRLTDESPHPNPYTWPNLDYQTWKTQDLQSCWIHAFLPVHICTWDQILCSIPPPPHSHPETAWLPGVLTTSRLTHHSH